MLADYKTQIEQNIVCVLTEDNNVRGLLVAFREDGYYFTGLSQSSAFSSPSSGITRGCNPLFPVASAIFEKVLLY
jgi:hypothetical protein